MAEATCLTTLERFWAKVDRNGPISDYAPHLGPCWTWTAHTCDGYGTFWVKKHVKAHRFSYALLFGGIPDGCQIDHLCRVRHCVNPVHLEPVTQLENRRRIPEKTHCPQGHPYAGLNLFFDRGAKACLICRRNQHREAGRRYRAARRDPRLSNIRHRQLLVVRLLANGPQSLRELVARSPGLALHSAEAVVGRLRRRGFVECAASRDGHRPRYALTSEGTELLLAAAGWDRS